MGAPGLEPGTSALSGLRSNQLSYAPYAVRMDADLHPSTVFGQHVECAGPLNEVRTSPAGSREAIDLEVSAVDPLRESGPEAP